MTSSFSFGETVNPTAIVYGYSLLSVLSRVNCSTLESIDSRRRGEQRCTFKVSHNYLLAENFVHTYEMAGIVRCCRVFIQEDLEAIEPCLSHNFQLRKKKKIILPDCVSFT